MIHRVFIGMDARQPISYSVLHQSIISRITEPVTIAPLKLDTLPLTRQGLTPFTWSRFLVPWLCEYKGWALFMDVDMVLRDDICQLFKLADDQYAVMAVKNQRAGFEWASLILYNCGHPSNAVLTPEYVETTQDKLHQMGWLKEEEVGSLPHEWNHCVEYAEPNPNAKLVHYTAGVPAFPETVGCEHAKTWLDEYQVMKSTAPWATLMARSVHAPLVMRRLQGVSNA